MHQGVSKNSVKVIYFDVTVRILNHRGFCARLVRLKAFLMHCKDNYLCKEYHDINHKISIFNGLDLSLTEIKKGKNPLF